MKTSVNRELKYFAKDFTQIRTTLKSLNARFVEKKEQKDYFYHTLEEGYLLKLRCETGQKKLVYYHPTHNTGQRQVSFKVWNVNHGNLKEILDSVLKVKGVIEKNREVWIKANVIFHLDTVYGVGKIFEIESEDISVEELDNLKKRFLPCLGS